MIKVVIVDDENSAIESLNWELTGFSDSIEVVAKFSNPEEGIAFLQSNKVDCLFLDIEMPTMDGFQFLDNFPDRNFDVVITTAYNEYAIEALKNSAIDYLMKPVDSDDLKVTIDKLIKRKISSIDRDSTEKFEQILHTFNEKLKRKKIVISADGKLIFLEPKDIIFVESDGNYSSIHLSDGKKIVVTKKIKEVNELLPSNVFFRIHNSFIVNLDKVKEFYKTDGYVLLDKGHKIPVSRQKKSDFLKNIS